MTSNFEGNRMRSVESAGINHTSTPPSVKSANNYPHLIIVTIHHIALSVTSCNEQKYGPNNKIFMS